MLQEGGRRFEQYHGDTDKAKAGLAQLLSNGLRTWTELYGDFPLPVQNESTTKTIPGQVLNLDKEWLGQAGRLADLFAADLGQSRDQYIEMLPRFTPQPESYRDRFDLPTLVQVPTEQLTLVRMCEIMEVVNYISKPKEVKDWAKDPGKFRTPSMPYATWLHDGARNLNRSIQDARASLAGNERGGTVFDGLALYINNPGILKGRYLDLPGSQCGSDYVPSLDFWNDRPELYDFWVGHAHPRFGSVVAGRNIVIR